MKGCVPILCLNVCRVANHTIDTNNSFASMKKVVHCLEDLNCNVAHWRSHFNLWIWYVILIRLRTFEFSLTFSLNLASGFWNVVYWTISFGNRDSDFVFEVGLNFIFFLFCGPKEYTMPYIDDIYASCCVNQLFIFKWPYLCNLKAKYKCG